MYSLTREASQHIDAYVPRHLHVPLEVLMENAGRGIADALVDVEGDRFTRILLQVWFYLCAVLVTMEPMDW